MVEVSGMWVRLVACEAGKRHADGAGKCNVEQVISSMCMEQASEMFSR